MRVWDRVTRAVVKPWDLSSGLRTATAPPTTSPTEETDPTHSLPVCADRRHTAWDVPRVWRVSLALIAIQLVGMLLFTTAQYRRFNLTNDFANYSQAWFAIAHGHLDPYSSIVGFSFWHNDLELLMWPLAVFYWLYPHSVTLLWLQVLAVVGAEIVVLRWTAEVLTARGKQDRYGAPLLGVIAGLLVLTPWSWFTIGFDFHLETFATLFALLAARELWAGRYRLLVIWVPLTLASCAAPGSLYVIAIGLAAFLARRGPRVIPVIVVLVGCAWIGLAREIGGMEFGGAKLAEMYGYLAGHDRGHLSYSTILFSLITHPLRALEMLRLRAGYVEGYVASGGVIGLTSRWGLLPATIVLLPAALNELDVFIHFNAAFQSWVVVLLLVAGSALALQRISLRASGRVVALYAGLTLAVATIVTARYTEVVPTYLDRVSPAAVAKLAALAQQIPGRVELIASENIIGRFSSGRNALYYLPDGSPERFAIDGGRKPVWFLLVPLQGTGVGNPAETLAAITYVSKSLDATPVSQSAGVWAFRWQPPRGTTFVSLP